MNKKAKALIKELAMQAKERMKNKSYGTKEETIELKRYVERQNQIKLLSNMECKKPEITIKIINDSVDEENFKNRVYQLLIEDEDLLNPLAKLIDKTAYESFDEPMQEKYILELAEKYNKVRENYFKECARA